MTIKIPKLFKLQKKDCHPYVGSKGLVSDYPKIYTDIGYNYYDLLCLISKCRNVVSIPYKSINAMSEYQLLNILKLIFIADKLGVKGIVHNANNDSTGIIAFRDNNNMNYAYLQSYVYAMSDNNQVPRDPLFDKYNMSSYIEGKLNGYNERDIRGFYLLHYILHELPKDIRDKIKQLREKSVTLKKTSYKHDYLEKYNAIKAYDNFAAFDKKFDLVKKRGDAWIEEKLSEINDINDINDINNNIKSTKSTKSTKFQKYCLTKKVIKYAFNLQKLVGKNNPFYTLSVKKELDKFIKTYS